MPRRSWLAAPGGIFAQRLPSEASERRLVTKTLAKLAEERGIAPSGLLRERDPASTSERPSRTGSGWDNRRPGPSSRPRKESSMGAGCPSDDHLARRQLPRPGPQGEALRPAQI